MNDDALQALMDMGDRLTASMRENPDGTHTTDDEWAWLLTLSASTVHLIRNLRGARVERDALAAKVADAWDGGYTRGFYDREVMPGEVRDASEGSSVNPYRATLTETEKP